ncbi:MAG TPA: methyltransferase domain-containing protein [Syntrophales bacterium]|nr:methyltransferase domain-containing protein [Smithella sp.]HOQ71337.1 methyltransferase domain-containing protein [Smithellaceae bacterium]HPN08142.1 methyltransferase domain-containing protein [Syntrophales bacterium]HPV49497.1 methyltransferase domain-containing protein [Smithellaceae bacterium]HPX81239.1 methyltransferase domain-containing protein [Syntrophales bacterium]
MNYEGTANEPPAGSIHKKNDSPDKVIDLTDLDWNRLWKAKLAARRSVSRDAAFWDGRASAFAKSTDTIYCDKLLSLMNPEAHWTVYDMGCGSGALAIPLAQRVSSVTAVDFSARMLDVINDRCKIDGISNVKTILGSWEDDWAQLGVGNYDIVIASRSLVVDDLQSCILKLAAVAKKRVYIVTAVGDGPHDRRLFTALGRPFEPGPDYIYYYNVLYHLGIRAQLSFIEEIRDRTFESPDDAAESMKWMLGKLTALEEKKLAAYVGKNLIQRLGKWRLSYSQTIRWAVMWWEKE